MASTQTEKTEQKLLPLEEAQTLAPRLASAFFLDNALAELQEKRSEITEAEYNASLELICFALTELQPETIEA
tara:strand:+ start:91 stop:309 length:219 start_codon:yes stop_codon:yes gene_type:complete